MVVYWCWQSLFQRTGRVPGSSNPPPIVPLVWTCPAAPMKMGWQRSTSRRQRPRLRPLAASSAVIPHRRRGPSRARLPSRRLERFPILTRGRMGPLVGNGRPTLKILLEVGRQKKFNRGPQKMQCKKRQKKTKKSKKDKKKEIKNQPCFLMPKCYPFLTKAKRRCAETCRLKYMNFSSYT